MIRKILTISAFLAYNVLATDDIIDLTEADSEEAQIGGLLDGLSRESRSILFDEPDLTLFPFVQNYSNFCSSAPYLDPLYAIKLDADYVKAIAQEYQRFLRRQDRLDAVTRIYYKDLFDIYFEHRIWMQNNPQFIQQTCNPGFSPWPSNNANGPGSGGTSGVIRNVFTSSSGPQMPSSHPALQGTSNAYNSNQRQRSDAPPSELNENDVSLWTELSEAGIFISGSLTARLLLPLIVWQLHSQLINHRDALDGVEAIQVY